MKRVPMAVRVVSSALSIFVLLAGLAAMPIVAAAQAYPSRSIRMIVPYAPGGAADPVGRIIAARLGNRLGQAVVVENHAGAGGNIGADIVARAEPDGYTLMTVAASTMTVNQSLYPNMQFNPLTDFAPVSIVVLDTIILVANPSLPVKSIRDLIALAKEKPGQINYASGGVGSGGHLSMELLKSMAHINLVHVPFKSAGESLTSLLTGEVSLTFTSSGSVLQFVKNGKLRAIATATKDRLPNLPDLPTVAESGVPGFEVTGWYALIAPAKTPDAIVQKLNREVKEIVAEPATSERLSRLGLIPSTSTSAELGDVIKSDSTRWAKVIKDANIKID